ncbi:MAG: GNAT family N-acetyltransferase [Bacteroidia bacterium]|nr:GNAT family N-acetyltransferase [Bacteroidia bacterium]
MMTVLTTSRLVLREFGIEDATFIIELLNSPGWLQYIGDRNVKTIEQAVAYLNEGPLRTYREFGFGLSCVTIKETGEPIGMCGLLRRGNLDHPDVGYAFLSAYHGQGYAEEIVGAMLVHARTYHRFSTIYAITLPNNSASIRLLEKLKMRYVKTLEYPGSFEQLSLYST